MYNLPRDIALKKKKQALRRLSQSGSHGSVKPLISPIHAGKKFPAAWGAARGGKLNTSAPGNKNPFQLGTPTSISALQPQTVNPYTSASQSSKQQPFAQSEQLFKSSGNELPTSLSNPFFMSSNPFNQSSSSTNTTTGAALRGRSYAQALNTGGKGLNDSGHTPIFASSHVEQSSKASSTENAAENPFARSSGLKLQDPRHARGKVEARSLKFPEAAPPSAGHYTVSLSVRNIDQQMCTPEILRNHFQQFGDVSDLKCMPRKGMATVSFTDHKAALRAKQLGTILEQSYPPLHIVLQKRKPSSSHSGTGGSKSIASDYIWVHPSMQLAAAGGGGVKREVVNNQTGPQMGKSPIKSSVFDRLGDPVEGAVKDKSASPVSLQQQEKQQNKYSSPQNQDSDYVPNKEDWEQEEYDDKFIGEQEKNMANIRVPVAAESTDVTMDTIARHVGHTYDLRSLHRGTGGGDVDTSTGVGPVSLVGVSSAAKMPSTGPLSSLSTAQAYEILEGRDNLLRKNMVKQTSLATAQAIVGTCPDMCPEKERYRRENTKRLSVFEVSSASDSQNPQVDHTKAVKEYSGSAADKDEPLPHELRPPHVLAMTMDYLVTKVIDHRTLQGTGEWFNFIWNRTRAIRKDITLQHLCSPLVAEVVEKCARFHVLCSHFMCEEGVSSFDASLNSDNLSKCLQTLKEFYKDLRKKGIDCRNEPEFCCYDILLHLNEGDVLCRVGDYTPGIYRHPLVRFAVQVALAWGSNNFVRFFRLVRSATYLNCCLLHRHFNQMRTIALGLLLRTHTAVKQSSYFSVADMQDKMLCLENREQVMSFCDYHGIRVEESGSHFVLSRETYIQPDKPYEVTRSRELVEKKICTSLGEVVQGGPLPKVPNYIPVSSLGSSATPSLPAVPIITYDDEDVAGIVENIVCAVLQSEISLLVGTAVSEVQQFYLACDHVGVGLIDDVIAASCWEIIQQAFTEERETIRKEKEERERLLDTLAWDFVAHLVGEIAASEANSIAKSTLQEECLLAELYRNAVNNVMLQMMGVVVSVTTRAIAEESVKEAITQRKQHLSFIASSIRQKRTARYFAYWHRVTVRRQEVKNCLKTFPAGASLRPLSWLLEHLQPSGKKPRLDLPADPINLLQNRTSAFTGVINDYNMNEEERKQFWSPVSIPDLVFVELATRFHSSPPSLGQAHSSSHHQWQLVLVLPPATSSVNTTSIDWLRNVLSAAPPTVNTCSGAVELLSLSSDQKIKVIVKSCQGTVCPEEQHRYAMSLKGTSAILAYFIGSIEINRLLDQLKSFVINNIKPFPRIPLIVLYDSTSSLTETEVTAIEEALYASFPVLSVIEFISFSTTSAFSQFQNTHKLREELCEAIRWLALHSSLPPVLTWKPLYDYMEQGLLELFLQPLMADHKLRLTLGAAPQPCRGVVAFYNATIKHLALMAATESLAQLSWPCEEMCGADFSFGGAPPIHWNETEHLANLHERMLSLQIAPPENFNDDISLEGCVDYVKTICKSHKVLQPLPLISNIHRLLLQQQVDKHVPWAHVISMCMSHVLKSIGPDQWVCLCHDGVDKKLPKFKEPPEWLTCMASTTLARVQHYSSPTSEHSRPKNHKRHWTDPLSGPIVVHSNYYSPHVKNTESMKTKLFSTLEREQLLNQEFDELLLQYTSTHNNT